TTITAATGAMAATTTTTTARTAAIGDPTTTSPPATSPSTTMGQPGQWRRRRERQALATQPTAACDPGERPAPGRHRRNGQRTRLRRRCRGWQAGDQADGRLGPAAASAWGRWPELQRR